MNALNGLYVQILYFAPEITGNDKSQIADEEYNKDPEKFEENRKKW